MARHKTAIKKLSAKERARLEKKQKHLKKQERLYREYEVPEDNLDECEKKLKLTATKGGTMN